MSVKPPCDVCGVAGRWIGPLPGQRYAVAACDLHAPTSDQLEAMARLEQGLQDARLERPSITRAVLDLDAAIRGGAIDLAAVTASLEDAEAARRLAL